MPDVEASGGGDLNDVINASIDTAGIDTPGGDDDGGDTSTETAATETGSEATAAGDTKPATFDHIQADKRGMLPYARHEAMIRAREADAAALKTQLDALKWATEPGVQDKLNAMALADSNPELFLKSMAEALDGDAELADNWRTWVGIQRAAEAAAASPKAAAAGVADGDLPQPDLTMTDGTRAYSEEQHAKLVQALVKKEAAALVDERVGALERRLKPFEESAANTALDTKAQRTQQEAFDQAKAEWPNFEENREQVHNWLKSQWAQKKHPTLEQACRKVLIPLLVLNDDAQRKRLVEDANKRAKTPAHGAPKDTETRGRGEESTRDIIARHAARLDAR